MKYIKICLFGCLLFITGWTNITIVPSESKMYVDRVCRDIPESVFANTDKEIRVITASKEDGIIAYKYNGDSFKLNPADIKEYISAWNQADFLSRNVPPVISKPDDDIATVIQILITSKISIRELQNELETDPDNVIFIKELERFQNIYSSYKTKLNIIKENMNPKPLPNK